MPSDLVRCFLSAAQTNTDRPIETCGILAGKEINNRIVIMAIYIPDQKGTHDSCEAFDSTTYAIPMVAAGFKEYGWIHTHPR